MCGVNRRGYFAHPPYCMYGSHRSTCTASLECADDAGDGPRREAQMTWFFKVGACRRASATQQQSLPDDASASPTLRAMASLSTLHKMVVR